MTNVPSLPNLPSALIRLALADLEKAEKSSAYRIDMGTWHSLSDCESEEKPVCFVCLAGAVMAFSFNLPSYQEWAPLMDDGFPLDVKEKMLALDSFRSGFIEDGLIDMRIIHPETLPDVVEITRYRESPGEFKSDMAELADLLEEHGL